jgi:hypothetical protein
LLDKDKLYIPGFDCDPFVVAHDGADIVPREGVVDKQGSITAREMACAFGEIRGYPNEEQRFLNGH